MMKKLTLSLLALAILCAPVFAEEEDGPGVYPYETELQTNENVTTDLSHWSLYIPVGFTFADMDETNGAKLGSGISDLTMNMGLGVEYTFTPTWSLSLEFNAANYGKHSFKSVKQDDGTRAAGTSLGVVYNVGAWLQFDLMDAFFPKRMNTLFNLYLMGGGGIGFYQYQREGDTKFYTDLKPWKSGKEKNFDQSVYMGGGALLDFNLSRNVSLGIRGLYYYYMTDNLDKGATLVHKVGEVASQDAGGNSRANSNNDGIFTADLVLHYNFMAREKSHARNMSAGRLADLERGPIQNNEVVPYVPQKDTLVISHKDTLVMVTEEKETVKAAPSSEMHFVYFDNNKYKLNDRGHIEVQQMAALLEANPDACLELSGHTDATASDEYNAKLAEKRAAAVRDELINVYGIDESRLVDLGRGKLTNVDASFGPNRRVDMRIVTREQVDSIRAEKEASKKAVEKKVAPEASKVEASTEAKAAEASSATTSEKAAEASVETGSEAVEASFDTTKYIAVEKTGTSTSLSKLARKYYGNTFCWVYIYLENKDVIKTPNYLWPNTKLYIPRLTEEQLAITKEAADAMFANE